MRAAYLAPNGFTTGCSPVSLLSGNTGPGRADALALEDGGPVPVVFTATTGHYLRQTPGPGTVSLSEVRAGATYRLYVGIPDLAAPQRYSISTSLK